MPLGKGGRKAMRSFQGRYGKKLGRSVAYATANARGRAGGLYRALHGKRRRKKRK